MRSDDANIFCSDIYSCNELLNVANSDRDVIKIDLGSRSQFVLAETIDVEQDQQSLGDIQSSNPKEACSNVFIDSPRYGSIF